MLIDNHVEANRGKIEGQLSLEHNFGFCRTFRMITNNLGFHLAFKTADLGHIVHTTIGDDINVTIKKLYFYIPIFIPSAETQALFNESIKNNYTIAFGS